MIGDPAKISITIEVAQPKKQKPEYKYIKIHAKDGFCRIVETYTRVSNLKQKYYGDDLYEITFTVHKRRTSHNVMRLGILQEAVSVDN